MIDKIIQEDLSTISQIVKTDTFNGKKALVTGGAGFIGSWICDLLINSGAEVVCVDDFSTGRYKNVDHLNKDSKFKLLTCDASTFKTDIKFDYILHLAGHASPDEYMTHPIETLQASAAGSVNMAELARKNDATLLFASTSEVYGDAEVVPTSESYWGKVNPIGPRSCYDEGKRFAEALLVAYSKQYKLDVKIPRIFNSYGPRLREDGLYGRAMSRFIDQALAGEPITVYGDGMQTRSFCYVSDTITALMLILASKQASGEVINVGNANELTILSLAERIKAATKSKSPFVFKALPKDDPKRRCPNTDKLVNIVNWKPTMPLEDGLSKILKWFSLREK